MADYSVFTDLLNEEKATDFLNDSTYDSWAWRLFPKQRMSARSTSTPVRGAAVPATWVTTAHRKAYVQHTVTAQRMIAGELAQITAVADEDLQDVDFDIPAYLRVNGQEAILRGLDETLSNATQWPVEWPAQFKAVYQGAVAASNVIDETGNAAADAKALATRLKANGFATTAFVVAADVSSLWGVTAGDLNNTPALTGDSPENYRLHGMPVSFVEAGTFGDASVVALATPHFRIGVREDVTFKQSDVATIVTKSSGSLNAADIISAFGDDVTLFRVMARFGFAHSGDATHYPAAIARPALDGEG